MFFDAAQKLVDDITARLAEVRGEMAEAAVRSGRHPDAVRLVAVTKTHPPALLQAALAAGITEIGENYLQEADDKFTALGWPDAGAGTPPVNRHFIGHLQSNKARKAARWFETIETVDSLEMAERLNRIGAETGRVIAILLQINMDDEKKSGFSQKNAEGILTAFANLAHIQVNGLMTIGRFEPNPEAARRDFIALRALRESLRAVAPPTVKLDELSMGMSHDFTVAIEEGATIVRVGSRLFGFRHP
jgi:pyridoxal phosphate enzyme (YggS family)